MNKKSWSGKFRILPAHNGIQVNFCKSPTCANFGVPAKVHLIISGRPKKSTIRDTYEKDIKKAKTSPGLPYL